MKLTSSIPIRFKSGITFSETFSTNVFLSPISSRSFIVQIISRMLPSRTSATISPISLILLFKKFCAAILIDSGSGLNLTLTAESTKILIQSAVGTESPVLISRGISFKDSLSTRSKNGILKPALPISTFGFLRIPEIINAVSGGALIYPATTKMIASNATMPTGNRINKSIFYILLMYFFLC